MTKISNRKLFNFPKHEHYGTGIASGLGSRPGYRMGGQVKPKRGIVDGPGGYAGEKELESSQLDLSDILNQISPTYQLSPEQAVERAKTLRSGSVIPDREQYAVPYQDYATDYSKYAMDYSPYATDYSKYKPTTMDAIGATAAKTIEDMEITPANTLGRKSLIATLAKNFQQQAAKTKSRRQELDMLTEESKTKMSMLTAENKNKLDIATGENATQLALKEAEQRKNIGIEKEGDLLNENEKVLTLASNIYTGSLNKSNKEKLTQGERFLEVLKNPLTTAGEIFKQMDALGVAGGYTQRKIELSDNFDKNVWMKQNWDYAPGKSWDAATKDKLGIPTKSQNKDAYEFYVKEKNKYIANNLNEFFKVYSTDNRPIKFTDDLRLTTEVSKNIEATLSNATKENLNNENLNAVLNEVVNYPSQDARDLALGIINLGHALTLDVTDENRRWEQEGRPFSPSDLDSYLTLFSQKYPELENEFDNLKEYTKSLKPSEIKLAEGGRVGYANGGQVGLEYEDMRNAFTSSQINDYDLKLILNDRTMLGDFALIRNYTDIEDFNEKYDTNIDLPIG